MTKATDFIPFAHALADAAATQSLPLFRTDIKVQSKQKDNFDPVTQADQQAEKAMRALIEEKFPDHAIMGEEFGATQSRADSPFQWVLDPIDGTKAFITGLPSWGTLIGLAKEGVPILGVFDQPFTGERVTATQGGQTEFSCQDAKRVLTTRPCARLEDAMLATTSPALFADTPAAPIFDKIASAAQHMRYGGDGYNYAMLAAGQLDGVLEQDLKPHDIQALIPIVESAGGRITNWHGQSACAGGQVLACGDAALHKILLAALTPYAL